MHKDSIDDFNHEKIENILKSQPVKKRAIFAGRCAIRVLPIIHIRDGLLLTVAAAISPFCLNVDALKLFKLRTVAARRANAINHQSNADQATKAAIYAAAYAAISAYANISQVDADDEPDINADPDQNPYGYPSAYVYAAAAYAANDAAESVAYLHPYAETKHIREAMLDDLGKLEDGVDLASQPIFNSDVRERFIEFEFFQQLSNEDDQILSLLQSIAAGTLDQEAVDLWVNEQAEPLKGLVKFARPLKRKSNRAIEKKSSPFLAKAVLVGNRFESIALEDVLNRQSVTQALGALLLEREDCHPFAIGLFGHWGAGKSSQIAFLKQALEQKNAPIKVAEFNAWYNEKASNIGAMLAQTVVDVLVAELGFFKRLRLAIQLSSQRRSKIHRALKQDGETLWFKLCSFMLAWSWLIHYLFWIVVIGVVLLNVSISESLVALFGAKNVQGIGASLELVIKVGAYFGGIYALACQFMSKHLTEWFKKIEMDKAIGLFRLPDYSQHKGLNIELHQTLRDICRLQLSDSDDPKQGKYLLLVVDDLDRCSVDAVKEVLDAVRLVAHIPRVVTLVAIDERMAFAAVEKHYQQFGHAGRTPALVARDYLAKVFQVSMTLPPSDEAGLKRLIDETMFKDIQLPEPSRAVQMDLATADLPASDNKAPTEQKQVGEQTIAQPKLSSESQHEAVLGQPLAQTFTAHAQEKQLFEALAVSFAFHNPRLLWRLYMAWKLLKILYFSKDYNEEEIEIPMRMLFWQEWLHTQEVKQKNSYEHWMKNGGDQVSPPEMPSGVYEAVNLPLRNQWSKLTKLVGYVDMVLLPSAIDKILDSKSQA